MAFWGCKFSAAPWDVVVLCHGISFHCADVTWWGLVDQNPSPAISSLTIVNSEILPWKALTVGMAGCFPRVGRESLLLCCWISLWMQRLVPTSQNPYGTGYSVGSNLALPASAVSQGSFILLWIKVVELLAGRWDLSMGQTETAGWNEAGWG